MFPKSDDWNRDISKDPVDPNSAALIARFGSAKPLHPDWGTRYGIPFQFVDATTPRVRPTFTYPDESDPGPYPLPGNPLIEGVLSDGPNATGDRHILCIDAANHTLYELFACKQTGPAQWSCGSGAIFDLSKPSTSQRAKGKTSADAAGLPIFPGLARYDEICINHNLTHALRFTLSKTRRAYIPPASHFASNSSDPALPPMGLRVRLKASFDLSPFSPDMQALLKGLKTYGLILADNGSDFFISGAPDPRWNDDDLNTLKKIHASDLEVIKIGPPTSG